MHRRLLLLLALGALLLMPSLVEQLLFTNRHWLLPFIVWALLILITAAAEWRHRHHEL
ncbi:hypothetical protein [Marinobacterium weihaiense]|uniref:Uncharacterized protein n=1 Tax=Marinobacterium weihaiense TaxID=2851016 RepID=A0ABS6MD24_9GAMM|nr:hypothetical protein [Marinobacterium weihaiense]MBV0934207.1 hypothetical protein [Marinobacterium weihaiense]